MGMRRITMARVELISMNDWSDWQSTTIPLLTSHVPAPATYDGEW
jgi:hypothetical protein